MPLNDEIQRSLGKVEATQEAHGKALQTVSEAMTAVSETLVGFKSEMIEIKQDLREHMLRSDRLEEQNRLIRKDVESRLKPLEVSHQQAAWRTNFLEKAWKYFGTAIGIFWVIEKMIAKLSVILKGFGK